MHYGSGVTASIDNYAIYPVILPALLTMMPLAALVIVSIGAIEFFYFG